VLVIDRGEGTLAALNIISRELHGELGITVAVANPAGLAWEQRRAHITSDPDGHAGEEETALVLALAPERVRFERLADEPAPLPLSCSLPRGPMLTPYALSTESGYVGHPALATAETGRAIFDAMVVELVEHVDAWWKGQGAA
jgi:creatinine amidohydrolase